MRSSSSASNIVQNTPRTISQRRKRNGIARLNQKHKPSKLPRQASTTRVFETVELVAAIFGFSNETDCLLCVNKTWHPSRKRAICWKHVNVLKFSTKEAEDSAAEIMMVSA